MDQMTWEGPDTGEVGEWDFTLEQQTTQEELAAKDDWWVYNVCWVYDADENLHAQITWKVRNHVISMFNSPTDGWKIIEVDNHTWYDTSNMHKQFATVFGYDWGVKFPLYILEQIDGDLHEWGRIITNIKYVGKTVDQIDE